MPRIRTIKPEFFRSDDVSALPLRARLTWIGLWTQCDDQGRMKDHVKLIKAGVWPLDPVSLADIEDDLRTLAAAGRIVRYQADGERYLAVTNWSRHQKINRPTVSHIPPPPNGPAPAEHYASEPKGTDNHNSTSTHGAFTEDSRGERKGKEGKGRDTRASFDTELPADHSPTPEPPLKCEEHTNIANPPPCGGCKDARREHMAWLAARNARIAAMPKCPTHRGQPAHNCSGCRADHLAGATA